MAIERIAVIGAGFMGSGIAQVAAQAGYSVFLTDTRPKALERARSVITWSVEKLAAKEIIQERPDAVLNRITFGEGVDGARDADLVIEAVFEDIPVKITCLAQLDAVCKPAAILASNTSTIPITKLAEATRRPERVIGAHFFGPVPLMRLVEIIPNPKTLPEVIREALDFARKVGKNPVLVKKDLPGFLMNRIFGAMACEAIRLVESGAGSVADIDQGMMDGFNMRMGPLGIADLAGLDISLNAFKVMHELDPATFCAPPALLERLVREGKLGAKTGEGFYKYDDHGKAIGPAF